MIRFDRLVLLIVPLALGLILAALPGAAQTPSARFVFADTTLLRDTLDLRFDQLFPLADSLRMTPDTLRALSVRYRLGLSRLVYLADSLAVPVDSVGPLLERERYNPLATTVRRQNDFRYTSSYNIAQTSSSWVNGSDYSFALGSLYLRNSTNITMDRFRAGGGTSLRQVRTSTTETGWRFSPDLSMGGRANLERYDNLDPRSTNNEGEKKNEFQLSVRTRQRPREGVSSEINLFSGLLDLTNSTQQKRGVSGDLSGRVRIMSGSWLTHDINGQVNGNFARTRTPNNPLDLNTRDLANNLRGTLGLFAGAPVGLNANYSLRHIRVEVPVSGRVQPVRTDNGSLDATLRLRRDTDRYLNLTEHLGNTQQATASALNSRTSRDEGGFTTDGRYSLQGWGLEGRFSNGLTVSKFPVRDASGGYSERQHARSLDGSLTRSLGPQLTAKLDGSISLTSFRYSVIGRYTNVPVSRDQYRQSYRLEVVYTRSQYLNSAVALDVSRNLFINIPSASTGANNQIRTYGAEWRWTYRLLPGLTATQRNQITADYTDYNFLPQSNRLNLDYGTLTTLNAVLSPRLTVDINHNGRYQPGGNYTQAIDGLYYFSRADDTRNYTLSARIAYSPSPVISLTVEPNYMASDRNGTLNGEVVPQRRSRSLNASGGVSLNLPLGPRGRLTGDIHRNYRADRSTTYSSGVTQVSPRAETDFWTGSLQLSWQL